MSAAAVRKEIGPIATPDVLQFAPALPKARGGKIMRRILRKIGEGVWGIWGIPARWRTRRWLRIWCAGGRNNSAAVYDARSVDFR